MKESLLVAFYGLFSYFLGLCLGWRQGRKEAKSYFEAMTSKAEQALQCAEYWYREWQKLKNRRNG